MLNNMVWVRTEKCAKMLNAWLHTMYSYQATGIAQIALVMVPCHADNIQPFKMTSMFF
jgi:hypothetical protein